VTNYRDTPTYKNIRKNLREAPASEKLHFLRPEMMRWLSYLDGYTDLLKSLELSGSEEKLAEFKEYTEKIAQASLELKAIVFGLTDWHESE
jgi:hypothetical protein